MTANVIPTVWSTVTMPTAWLPTSYLLFGVVSPCLLHDCQRHTYCLEYCHHAYCMTVNVTYCWMYCHHAYCMTANVIPTVWSSVTMSTAWLPTSYLLFGILSPCLLHDCQRYLLFDVLSPCLLHDCQHPFKRSLTARQISSELIEKVREFTSWIIFNYH